MFRSKQLISEVLEFLREIEVYESYKAGLEERVRQIDKNYQRGSYGYLEYQSRLKEVLKDRSQQDWARYYNAYTYSLLKRIDCLLSEVYSEIVESKEPVKADPLKSPAQKAAMKAEALEKVAEAAEKKEEAMDESIDKKIAALRAKLTAKEEITLPEAEAVPRIKEAVDRITKRLEEKPAIPKAAVKEAKPSPEKPQAAAPKVSVSEAASTQKKQRRLAVPKIALPKITLPSIKPLTALIKFGLWTSKVLIRSAAHIRLPRPKLRIRPSAAIHMLKKGKPGPKASLKETPQLNAQATSQERLTLLQRLKSPFSHKKKKLFVEEIVEMEKQAKPKEAEPKGGGIVFGWFLGTRLIQDVLGRFRAKQEPIMADRTAIPVHVKKLREMRAKLYEAEHLGGFEETLLAQEAKRVKTLIEAEKPEIYRGSSIGLVANVTVKKISLTLVNTFPEFFGFMYNALRAANIKILSNTYVNIMILCIISLFIGVTFLLTILFFALNHPIYQIFLRSIIFGLIAAGMCATIFYIYPFMRIKERRRNMMTSMPFAINHIASVSASGVPPASMFELISQSKEYGEVAVEIKKIVDFMNIFGYDLLTAIRSVSATTPSIQFKEFLEGMVSTIETGGDLEAYLKQKAEEATSTYQLERQRYNESVSTYSDIYTGLLIAAPLFFIAALALINLLGGTLGGMGVDMIMALAAYALIPVLNIAFLIFLQVSQPEV